MSEAVVKSLLQLGASSAQVVNQVSPVQDTVHRNNLEVLKPFFKYDEPAARSILNHLCGGDYYIGFTLASPLLTAILTQKVAAVNVLLSLGAQTSIVYEEFTKYLHRKSDQKSWMQPNTESEQYQHRYKTTVQQPVILAIERDLPTVVQELLRRDVNPNTLTKTDQAVLLEAHNRANQAGTTLLDAIPDELAVL